jgi:hypothetical protein
MHLAEINSIKSLSSVFSVLDGSASILTTGQMPWESGIPLGMCYRPGLYTVVGIEELSVILSGGLGRV